MTEKKHKLKSVIIKFWKNINWKEQAVLFGIFLVSLLIRSTGLKYGFPLLTHPDEFISIDPVVAMTKNHTLNPGVFNRPQQVTYFFYYVYLNALSYLRFGQNLADAFPKYTINFYFYARFWVAVLGSLIPVIAYKIGKLFKNTFALPAALVFALFPLYALHSLYSTPDIPITLLTLLVMYFTIRYINKEDEKSIYLATLFAAVITAEKYPGLISMGLIILGLALKHFDNNNRMIRKKLGSFLLDSLKMTGVFLLCLFIVAPFLFIEYQKVIESLILESRSTHLGADNLGWIGNMWFYIRSFGNWTNLLSVLWIGLGVWGLIKWREKARFILLYGILYWMLLSALALHWERWALPMFITPLFLTAIGIKLAWQKAKHIPVLKFTALFLFIGFFLYQLIFTIQVPIRRAFTDTRVVSLEYCRQNEISIENSEYEGYTPFMPRSPRAIFEIERDADALQEHIILSSKMYERYYTEPKRYEEEVRYYEMIRNSATLLVKFEPEPAPANIFDRIDDIFYYLKDHLNLTEDDRLRGPTIEIYHTEN